MTADDRMTPDPQWDEARIALGDVAQLFANNPDATQEELRGLPNYQLIPESVRETVEGLTPDEHRFLTSMFTTLAQNHFYLENSRGGLMFY